MNPKLFILSIDGVPHSLVQSAIQSGKMPNFARLIKKDGFVSMNSIVPVVSSVAWATFSTGVNPGGHGIYGFVDRDADLNYEILTSRHFKTKSLWRHLSDSGKRVIAVNVPGTYPPEEINGIMIGDFLSPSIEKATHPQNLVDKLNEIGYIIDASPQLAHSNKSAFMEQLFEALEARERLTFDLLETEEWDLFMLHVMETDRINHFYFDSKDDPANQYHDSFWDFYAQVDALIGKLDKQLGDEIHFMILSDHGFCQIKREVDLNQYLINQGFLSFRDGARMLSDMDDSSQAYSLTPGRVYLNLEGRETNGSVGRSEAASLKKKLRALFLQLNDPETNDSVIDKIWEREELYTGSQLDRSADLIMHPRNGYDLKSNIESGELFSSSARNGMHTYEDALLYVRGQSLGTQEISIIDLAPLIVNKLEMPRVPHHESQLLCD